MAIHTQIQWQSCIQYKNVYKHVSGASAKIKKVLWLPLPKCLIVLTCYNNKLDIL